MFHVFKTKSSSKENFFFLFLHFWINKSLNILSVAPDRVQNQFNYGLNHKKYPPHKKEATKRTYVERSRKALKCDDRIFEMKSDLKSNVSVRYRQTSGSRLSDPGSERPSWFVRFLSNSLITFVFYETSCKCHVWPNDLWDGGWTARHFKGHFTCHLSFVFVCHLLSSAFCEF